MCSGQANYASEEAILPSPSLQPNAVQYQQSITAQLSFASCQSPLYRLFIPLHSPLFVYLKYLQSFALNSALQSLLAKTDLPLPNFKIQKAKTKQQQQKNLTYFPIHGYTLHLEFITSNPEFNSKIILSLAFKICLKFMNWSSTVLVVKV